METQLLNGATIVRMVQKGKYVYPNNVQDGLMVWYDFKGKQNSDVNKLIADDMSGNGNDGNLSGFNFQSGSGYDLGLDFDGVDDKITIPHTSSLSPTTKLSICATIKLETINVMQDIIAQGVSLGNNQTWSLAVSSSILYFDAVNPVTLLRENATFSLKTSLVGTKAHIAVVYDAGGVKFYLNGKEQPAIANNIKATTLRVQPFAVTVGTRAFGGELFSVQMYNKSLVESEITKNYESEKERWSI